MYDRKAKQFMTEENVLSMFTEHGIRPTANRLLVVRALKEAVRPLSLMELEALLQTLDKSSISRVLALLREHRLVHVIEDGGESVRYELCLSHHHDQDDDMHAHFYCERCRRTFCLEDVRIPAIALPEGYVMRSVNYVVKGVCPSCSGYDYVLRPPEVLLA